MLVIIFVIGIFSGFVFRRELQKPVAKFKSQAPLIKKYWKLVAPYMISVSIAYFVVWRFYYSPTNFSILGQISALVFAIFVGSIAFSALSENRFDKLFESGMFYASRGRYKTAAKNMQEAHSIKPRDSMALGNLLEFWALLGEYDKFDDRIEYYRAILIDDEDQLNYFYLKSLRHLLAEHIKEGKGSIKECVAFVNDNPTTRERFQWSFSELTESNIYKNLTGTPKNILDNFIHYLERGLPSPENEKSFVDGDYELRQTSLVDPDKV